MKKPLVLALAVGVIAAVVIGVLFLKPSGTGVEAGDDSQPPAARSSAPARGGSGSTGNGSSGTTTVSQPGPSAQPSASAKASPGNGTTIVTMDDTGLPTDGVIRGTVTLRETKEPVSGVTVRLERIGGRDMLEDGNAAAALTKIATRQARSEAQQLEEELALLKKGAGTPEDIEVAEHRLAAVNERISRAESASTAAPAGGEERMARQFGFGDMMDSFRLELGDVSKTQTAVTGSDGAYIFTNLVNGAYRVNLADDGYATNRMASGSVTLRGQLAIGNVDLAVEVAGIIEGIVTNRAGQPVEGATVQITQQFDGREMMRGGFNMDRMRDAIRTLAFRMATSGADGRYRVSVPPRAYEVACTAPGYIRSDRVEVTVTAGQASTADLRVETGGRIVVVVKNKAGEPVAGASVSINEGGWRDGGGGGNNPFGGGGRAGGGRTGGGGRMEFRARNGFGMDITQATLGGALTTSAAGMVVFDNLRDGTYGVRVSHANYVDVRENGLQVASGGEVRHSVILDEGAMIELMVMDPDGAPVAGAVANASSESPTHTAQGTASGEEGILLVRGVLEDVTYAVNVSAPGYASRSIDRAKAHDSLVITLPRLGRITGIVVDAITGNPIEAYRISSNRDDESGNPFNFSRLIGGMGFGEPEPHPGGKFELTNLEAGVYTISVFANDYAEYTSEPITLRENGAVEGLRLGIAQGATITGTVRFNGAAVANARVGVDEGGMGGAIASFVSQGWATTAANGTFTLKNQPAGSQRLRVTHSDYATTITEARTLTNGTQVTWDIEIDAGESVTGTVVGEDGLALTGATVTLLGQVGGIRAGTTDDKGFYEIKAVAAGEYFITLTMPGQQNPRDNKSVVVVDGGPNVINWNLKPASNLTLTGTVMKGGAPVDGANVSVLNVARPFNPMNARTAADGKYTFQNLEPGDYRITASSGPSRVSVNVTVAAATPVTTKDLVIPTGSIAGTVKDANGMPVAEARVIVKSGATSSSGPLDPGIILSQTEDTTDGTGAFLVESLDEGTYSVTVVATGYAQLTQNNVYVSAGSSVNNLAFVLSGGGTLRVNVVDTQDQPVAQALIRLKHPDGTDLPGNSGWWSALTDANGAYTNSTLAGEYRVEVSHADHPPVTVTSVVVSAGDLKQIKITMAKGHQVTVTVKNANGVLISGAKVDLIDAAGNVHQQLGLMGLFGGTTTTSQTGTVNLTGVGSGTWKVRITRQTADGPVVDEFPGHSIADTQGAVAIEVVVPPLAGDVPKTDDF